MDLTEEGVGRFDGFSQWECVKSMGFHKIVWFSYELITFL